MEVEEGSNDERDIEIEEYKDMARAIDNLEKQADIDHAKVRSTE